MQDWPILEEAIDAKIEDQAEFVAWWDENVRRSGGDNRSDTIVSDRDTMNVARAVTETGVTKLQVSRWRKHLRDRPKYRERMILAAYRKADLTPSEIIVNARGRGALRRCSGAQSCTARRAIEGLFRRTLAETEAGVGRTFVETQRTIGETDAQ